MKNNPVFILQIVESDEPVQVDVEYFIKDFSGNIYFEDFESFSFLDEIKYLKNFPTRNLELGEYVLGVKVNYGDDFATSSLEFSVVEGITFVEVLIVCLILLLLFLFYLLKGKRKSFEEYFFNVRIFRIFYSSDDGFYVSKW